MVFRFILAIDVWDISHEISSRWMMSLDLTDRKSSLVQVLAWCRQATSHYLSQCWPRSMSPYIAPLDHNELNHSKTLQRHLETWKSLIIQCLDQLMPLMQQSSDITGRDDKAVFTCLVGGMGMTCVFYMYVQMLNKVTEATNQYWSSVYNLRPSQVAKPDCSYETSLDWPGLVLTIMLSHIDAIHLR